MLHLRHRAGRGRGAGSAAGRRHHLAGHRRAAHGQAQRADAPAARGRNAGQHLGHLLGQDRHAHQGRDDRRGRSCAPGRRLACRAPATSRRASSRRRDARSSRRSPAKRLLRAAVLASDAHIVYDESERPVARQGRSDRGRADRRRRQGGTEASPSWTSSSRVCTRSPSPPKPSG